MSLKSQTKHHWIVLAIVSLMFAAFAGIINNVIGVFYSPVSESLGILRGNFALHHTITTVFVGLVSLVVPKIIFKFGWKPSLIGGVILAFIGTAGMTFTENIFWFYVLGAIRGIGAAFFGLVPLAILINNWFFEKNGFAMSVASGFSGLVGMIAAPIFGSMIAKFNWEFGFLGMAVLIVILNLPAILYPYSLTPEEDNLLPYGVRENEDIKVKAEKMSEINTVTQRIVGISFVAMIIFSLLHTNILGMNQHLSSYGESSGMSLQVSSYMLSAVMLGNVFFKLVIGPLSDRVGAIKSTLIMNGMNVIGIIILILTKSHALIIFSAFLFGSAFSVGSVALPLLSNQFFGKKLSNKIFPILTFTSSIGSAFSNTMVGYIFDFTGSYSAAFFIGITFQIINIFMLYLAYKTSLLR